MLNEIKKSNFTMTIWTGAATGVMKTLAFPTDAKLSSV